MKKIVSLLSLGLVSFVGFSQLQFNFLDSTIVEDFNTYQANGFSLNPTVGQLHSNNWSIKGFSDGNMNFGDEKSSGDFTGTSTITTTTGGLNPFQNSFDTRDVNFGISQTGSDFTPGELTLRVKNNTGNVITSVDVAYSFEFLNNNPRSSSFNFSYSSDNLNYISISALNDQTPEISDATAFWNSKRKTIKLQGLNIIPGSYIYIKWNSDLVSGLNGYDEIGLDDLSLTPFGAVSNRAPVALQGFYTLEKNKNITVNLKSHSYDLDRDSLSFSIPLPQNSMQGGFSKNGSTIIYTPTPNFTGIGYLNFKVCDTKGACDTSFITFTTKEPNRHPVAQPIIYNLPYGQNSFTLDLNKSISDADGDKLYTTTGLKFDSFGTISFPSSNMFKYILLDSLNRIDTTVLVKYYVTDYQIGIDSTPSVDSAIITINIAGVPPAVISGKVYEDKNLNNKYDLGEGIGGVRMTSYNNISSFVSYTHSDGSYTIEGIKAKII